MQPERVEHFTRMVEVSLMADNFDRAHAVIDRAEREKGMVYEPITLDSPISSLGLKSLYYEVCSNSNELVYIRDLAGYTINEFVKLPDAGWSCAWAIRKQLQANGFYFWDEVESDCGEKNMTLDFD